MNSQIVYKQAGWGFLINTWPRELFWYICIWIMQWKVELDSSSSLSLPLPHPRAASPIHIEAVVTIFLFFLLHWSSVEIMGITVLFTYFISNLAETFCHLYFLPSYIYFLCFSVVNARLLQIKFSPELLYFSAQKLRCNYCKQYQVGACRQGGGKTSVKDRS